eukprot:3941814-Rhodomonas_salina.1
MKDLAFSTLSPRWTIAELHKSVQDQYAHGEYTAQQTYLNMCDLAAEDRRARFPHLRPITWLPWLHTRHPTSEQSAPSSDVLHSCMKLVWSVVEKEVTWRMSNTSPGVGAKIDGTFRIAGKIIAGDHGKPKVLWFILGEDNGCVGWYALRSESWGEMHEAHLKLRGRLARNGTLLDLKYFWYDRCCQGRSAANLHRHPLVYIFPTVDRCPYADAFHHVDRVRSTCVPFHARHAAFAREMGACLRAPSPKHLEDVVQYCIKQHKVGRTVAEELARGKAYKKCIPCIGRAKTELARAWQDLMIKYAQLDQRDRELKKPRMWRDNQPNSGVRGTLHAAQRVQDCINKGCHTDPCRLEELFIPLLQAQNLRRGYTEKMPAEFVSVGQEAACEGMFKWLNALFARVSQMSQTEAQIKISVFLDQWNEGRRCLLLGGPKSDQARMPTWMQDYINFRSNTLLGKPTFPH